MNCYGLGDLPAPPPGKLGWPWTEGGGDTGGYGADWPVISIVTPSYMQGEFIEETIRSVLLQGYPGLEFIVLDGGSTDGTVEILRKYDAFISYWVSEPDDGQSDAIDRGLRMAAGDIGNWINSDDVLLPGSLRRIADEYRQGEPAIIAGDVIQFRDDRGPGVRIRQHGICFENFIVFWEMRCSKQTDALFFPMELYARVGGVDRSLFFSMDYDLYLRMLRETDVRYVHVPVLKFRLHDSSKSLSMDHVSLIEKGKVFKRYSDYLDDDVAGPVFRREYARMSLRKMVKTAGSGRFGPALSLTKHALSRAPVAFARETAVRALRKAGFGRIESGQFNWILERNNLKAVRRYNGIVSGRVLDIGCGTKPYAELFDGVTRYIGIEYLSDTWGWEGKRPPVDCWGDAGTLPFIDGAFDSIVCFQAIEHMPDPGRVMREALRVLRDGGTMLMTSPFLKCMHNYPHDFQRLTEFGLRNLVAAAGGRVLELRSYNGFWITLAMLICYNLYARKGIWRWFVMRPFYHLVNAVAGMFNNVDSDAFDPMAHDYIVIIRKEQV